MFSLYIDFLDSTNDQIKNLAEEALPFTILLGHSNSAFNPLLYYVMTHHLHERRKRSIQSKTAAIVGSKLKRPRQDATIKLRQLENDFNEKKGATANVEVSN